MEDSEYASKDQGLDDEESKEHHPDKEAVIPHEQELGKSSTGVLLVEDNAVNLKVMLNLTFCPTLVTRTKICASRFLRHV